jgi:enoyl-CoA hydratase/carnithine racemase
MTMMRESTLTGLGLGSVLEIFEQGKLPVDLNQLVDEVFGPASNRGSLVISGGSGIVGSGKAMQLGARLMEFGVPVIALDFPGAPDGLGGQYGGLKRAFGDAQASAIMSGIIRMHYDGMNLPSSMRKFNPRFVLEAIPEVLHIKRAHYDMWRKAYPGIELRSVTSGFPSKELGVGILHPSFPHQINKLWEVIEEKPSRITQMLWALGLIPLQVGDYWSFVLDVLFCGVTLAAIRYHGATNMPYFKVDKYVRRMLGPNPLRAHDAIGPGASFLTWSCLHHLSGKYGGLFEPHGELNRRSVSGESWYPTSRPVVDWDLDDPEAFDEWMIGPLMQMTSLLVKENRGSLSVMNAIGELCAQFSTGMPALARRLGQPEINRIVGAYHRRHPGSAASVWYPEAFSNMSGPEWQQLFVNAEHNGKFGVLTISRESINSDVIAELNRAIDWLKAAGIDRVALTGDFHLSTQLVGADTSEFYPALSDENAGFKIAAEWSKAARRLYNEFAVSVGFIHGKRCLGGMMELMAHCKYLVTVDSAQLGMPEVTLPVVPGMEGCHWPLRRCRKEDQPRIVAMLLDGKVRKASEAVGWLVDYAGSLEGALATARKMLTESSPSLALRKVEPEALTLEGSAAATLGNEASSGSDARRAIAETIRHSCSVSLAEALEVQARHSAGFMTGKACNKGAIGKARSKLMDV